MISPPPVAKVTAVGGTAILSGLLERQAAGVAHEWRRAGFRLAEKLVIGDWATLRLVRRATIRPTRTPAKRRRQLGGGRLGLAGEVSRPQPTFARAIA